MVLIRAPANYRKLLGPIAGSVEFSDQIKNASSFIHIFTKSSGELEKRLAILREKVADTGIVWVSWPKKSSGLATDVTEDVVRAVALPLGFVDVKVCAIDETWSPHKSKTSKEMKWRVLLFAVSWSRLRRGKSDKPQQRGNKCVSVKAREDTSPSDRRKFRSAI